MKKIVLLVSVLALTVCDKATAAGSDDYKNLQQAMDDCGEECAPVIATGDYGDFLIRMPETDILRDISNKEKSAKFLSTENPKRYAESGYCLVNVVPYNTMKNLGIPNNTCHYRIYCGAPENMDYDQYYAVEVCE